MLDSVMLYEMYVNQKLSMKKISESLGVSVKTVQKYLRQHKIPVRQQKKLIDLNGQRFGYLTVVRFSRTKKGCAHWICSCRCGSETEVAAPSLKNGLTKSCGCLRRANVSSSFSEDLTGKKFDRLTMIRRVESNSKGQSMWLCKCDCGNEIIRRSFSIKRAKNNKCESCPKFVTSDRIKSYEDISGQYFKSVRGSAETRNFEFSITIEDIWNTYINQNKECALSGLPIKFIGVCYHKNGNQQTASVDRIDSSKGYTKNNIQIVHKDLNIMKMSYSNDHFIKMCKLVAEKHS